MKILSICTKTDLYNLINIIKVINIIKIVIPCLLIIYTIIRLIINKEINKKLIKLFIINILLSLLIFFSPQIIYLINNYIHNEKVSCMKKIDNNTIKVMEIINKDNNILTKKDYEDANGYY